MNARDRFLSEFERALRLRGASREDAVREIACHIEDGVAAGEPEDEVVARLGTPRDIAARFNQRQRQKSLRVFAVVSFGALASFVAAHSLRAESSGFVAPIHFFAGLDGTDPSHLGMPPQDLPSTRVVGERHRLTAGDDWAVYVWTSRAGLCTGLGLAELMGPTNCGLPVQGAPRSSLARGRPGLQPFVASASLYRGRAWVTGQAAASVDRVEVALADGRTLEASMYDPPSDLHTKVRFFVAHATLSDAAGYQRWERAFNKFMAQPPLIDSRVRRMPPPPPNVFSWYAAYSDGKQVGRVSPHRAGGMTTTAAPEVAHR